MANRRVVIKKPVSDGRGPLFPGKTYELGKKFADSLIKSGAAVLAATAIAEALVEYGVVGIHVNKATTDQDMAREARKAGLQIEEVEAEEGKADE